MLIIIFYLYLFVKFPTLEYVSSYMSNKLSPGITSRFSTHKFLYPKAIKDSGRVKNLIPINQKITFPQVRVILSGNSSSNDTMTGVFPISEALAMAEQYETDLVLINEKGDPPVCKLIDFGKFKYEMDKKKKDAMKKQVKIDIKEIKMSYKIDQHDFDVRVRAAQKFLSDGDRVIQIF